MEVVSRGTMGGRRTATACRTRFLKARWVWGRSSSPRQSGRFGALLRRSLLLHEFPLFAERIRGPLNGMHFPTFCPCLPDGAVIKISVQGLSLPFMTRCKARNPLLCFGGYRSMNAQSICIDNPSCKSGPGCRVTFLHGSFYLALDRIRSAPPFRSLFLLPPRSLPVPTLICYTWPPPH